MLKLTMVIPTYTITKDLEIKAERAADTYRDYIDELIICEDGGMFSPKLMRIADTYIFSNQNKGFSTNVNRGWKEANGEYVAIVNSDTWLESGDLYDLCIPGKVTSPFIKGQIFDLSKMRGCFWVAPRELTDEIGMLDESMRTYWSDEDYINRLGDRFQEIPSVVVVHEVAQTVTPAGVNTQEESERDEKIFRKIQEERLHVS